MKRVATCLNETEYSKLRKLVEADNVSEYTLLKGLLQCYIHTRSVQKAVIVESLKISMDTVLRFAEKDLKETKNNLL